MWLRTVNRKQHTWRRDGIHMYVFIRTTNFHIQNKKKPSYPYPSMRSSMRSVLLSVLRSVIHISNAYEGVRVRMRIRTDE